MATKKIYEVASTMTRVYLTEAQYRAIKPMLKPGTRARIHEVPPASYYWIKDRQKMWSKTANEATRLELAEAAARGRSIRLEELLRKTREASAFFAEQRNNALMDAGLEITDYIFI